MPAKSAGFPQPQLGPALFAKTFPGAALPHIQGYWHMPITIIPPLLAYVNNYLIIFFMISGIRDEPRPEPLFVYAIQPGGMPR